MALVNAFHDIKRDKEGDRKTSKMREVLVASIDSEDWLQSKEENEA